MAASRKFVSRRWKILTSCFNLIQSWGQDACRLSTTTETAFQPTQLILSTTQIDCWRSLPRGRKREITGSGVEKSIRKKFDLFPQKINLITALSSSGCSPPSLLLTLANIEWGSERAGQDVDNQDNSTNRRRQESGDWGIRTLNEGICLRSLPQLPESRLLVDFQFTLTNVIVNQHFPCHHGSGDRRRDDYNERRGIDGKGRSKETSEMAAFPSTAARIIFPRIHTVVNKSKSRVVR